MGDRRPTEVANTEVAGGDSGPRDDEFDAPREVATLSEPSPTGAAWIASGASLAAGRFSILKRIGAGGMGVVYEARDSERQTRVALKMLHRLDAASTYQLKNEFRALGEIAHPNLIRLHELFADAGHWFFTMDLVEGERFDAWVRPEQHGFDERRLRQALAQLVDAVNAIHARGKLHRDLKPSNVLVTQDDRVVVLDFGLAIDTEVGGAGQTLMETSISGTPAYMAPEQGAGALPTIACDAYAIGVMLFEGLTGRLPFDGGPYKILVDKQRIDPPAPSTLSAGVPNDLDALCVALLAREAQARPSLTQLAAGWGTHDSRVPIAGVVHAPPKLYGREAELSELRSAFDAARLRANPVLVLLSGDSGIGKSALVETLLSELCQQYGALALSGRCFERESVPFKAFDAVVDALSRHLRRLSEVQIGALLPRDTFALRLLFPVLGRIPAFAAGPIRDVPDAHELRRRAFLAFGELLGRICDRQPLVLHLDDLQWSDADSITLLLHLLRQADAPALLMVASHRSEALQRHPCLAPLYELSPVRVDVRRLQVGPLAPEAAGAMLGAASGEARDHLLEEAAGNPFFLTELMRYASTRPTQSVRDLSLRTLVLARVDQLEDPERSVLETLAVAGRPIPLALALDAARSSAAPRTLFETLRVEHLGRATGDGSLVECFHDKIREAVLHSLAPQRLREHHAALAQALASIPNPDPEQLAGHLLGADRMREAAQQLVRAAERAMGELGFERAARLYAEALEYGQFEVATRLRLQMLRADALAFAGHGRLAAECYLAARESADGEAQIEITRKAAEQYLVCGQLARGRALLGEALRPLGIHVPLSATRLLVSLSWNRARLLVDRLQFVARDTHDPDTLRRLGALRDATLSLARSDQVRSADFAARYVLAALQAGHRVELARALALELILSGLIGTPQRAAQGMLALAEQLCVETNDTLARQLLCIGRGAHRIWARGELSLALDDCAAYYELAAAQPYLTMFHDRRWVQFHEASALCLLGRVSSAARLWEALLDEAWSSGDLTIVPGCALIGCMVLPAIGGYERAAYELQRARNAWQVEEVTVQETMLLAASLILPLYRGEARSAWDASLQPRQRMRRSLLGRVPIGKIVDAWSCSVIAAMARETGDGAYRRAILRDLAHHASRMRGVWHVQAPPIAPALACARGQPELAIAALRDVIEDPRTAPLFANAARRRLGIHVGGDEGRALVSEADAFFAAGGVQDPERYTAMLLPGVEF